MLNGLTPPSYPNARHNPSKTSSADRSQQKEPPARDGKQKGYRIPTETAQEQTLRSSSSSSSDHDRDGHQYELDKLRKRIRELQKREATLKMEISSLENQVDFSEQKCTRSEQKNRELIQKLSFEQVESKKLSYVICQLEQYREQLDYQQEAEEARKEFMTLQASHAKLKENHTSLTVMLRSILELLNRSKADSVDRAITKIKEVLERGVRFIDDNNGEAQQLQQLIGGMRKDEQQHDISTKSVTKQLETETAELKQEVVRLKELLEKEKGEKKRILPAYNDILHKLRESCSSLKTKVDEIYSRSERDKQGLEQLVTQKDQLINHLQSKNEQLLDLLRKSEDRERALLAQLTNGSVRSSRAYQRPSFEAQSEMTLQQIEPAPNNAHSKRSHNQAYIGDYKKSKMKMEMQNLNSEITHIIEQIQQIQQK